MYQRVKNTFHENFDTSSYGPLEIITRKEKEFINVYQVKAGTEIQHGRWVGVWYSNGGIRDHFMKDNLEHGPCLYINHDGEYEILRYENDEKVSRIKYHAHGGAHFW